MRKRERKRERERERERESEINVIDYLYVSCILNNLFK